MPAFARLAVRSRAAARCGLTVPIGVSTVRIWGNINWTFGGSGYRHVWVHKNGALFFGTAKESDSGDSGVQSIGTTVVDVTPGDYFELIARQTSGATKEPRGR